jgi:tetratricopeptide (TPR) repeat protein
VFQFQAEQYEATLATLRQRQTVLAAQASTDPIDRMGDLIEAGQALRHLGRYDEAEKVIKQCEALAERVVGRRGGYYIAAISSRALIENELGRRAQAMALFGEGMGIGANKGAAIGIDAAMRRFYGTVLATDGDAASAIPMLEDALRQTQIHPVDEQLGRIAQGALGDAYDQVGRTDEARAALHAARDEWVRYGVPDGEFTLGARERWARFLLEHGDLEGAQAECTTLLRVAADAPSAPAAAAQADLARVALLRGDARAADQLSARAMQTIEAARQGYDVRMRTDIWLTRGEILLANGQKPQAAELAARASAAAAESDAVSSRRLARARALVEKTK